MTLYRLDHLFEKLSNAASGARERKTLQELVGRKFTRKEAKFIWQRVLDHKWHLSQRLDRDVGLRVAATDYIENFHKQPQRNNQTPPARIPLKVFSQYDFFANVIED